MTSPQQLEILDLRHFNARQLRPLLEAEATLWHTRLNWDYKASTELLLEYLDQRILPGFVALTRGRIVGFCFCVYEGDKAVVGDVFASPREQAPMAILQTLARHLLEVLEHSPDLKRIEAQLLLFDAGVLPPLFGAHYRVFPRLFMTRELPGTLAPPPDFAPVPWAAQFYDATAELIQRAYVGHIDSEINDQYRTLAGSLRFLHNVIRFPGCGQFDPAASFVLREPGTIALSAVLLCSQVAPGIAHITQLCVASAQRGRSLGRALLAHTMRHLAQHGYRGISLTVTEANRSAVALYQAAGLRTRHRFDAMVYDKPARPKPLAFPQR